ncbi:multiple sugar transport system substrate-binding protein YtcQ [Niallia circulans]|jgi:putative aldouronate transport system substrate-binding protein|uniref:extracellular solute-binding protein n=1 Tax=Niallia circulans TaxID=1397 RepID=UPI00077CAD1A|nr:extracellular solute-binding protein [Niallia circulans]MDR4316788.1 extracellular solute-binding protein [Niallia circulans]MED3840218.1 extracellular solute-binding protein [Niallia circulans]MED4241906.1 extracellular solute-binding protein [Niallia circulans]MED4250144.1 extracellular solute-binding protein [Niallia circulans]QKH63639.1 extracellular solute-binding protein [Niallia circulans]
MKKLSKLASISLAGMLLLAGCSGGKEQSSGTYDENSKAEITWLNILHTASPPTDTILDKIEEKTNAEIKFSWIPDASKEERINTALASDSLADIVTLTILENSSVRNALKSGMFWNVEDYLDEFPNLKEISQDVRDSASIEGKLYGIPFQKDLARNGVVLRKDWLDNLGLEVPKTVDELMEVSKAFTENDPDGNGQNDTTGFVDRNDLIYGAFKTLSSYFGTPNVWEMDENGDFIPEFETDGYVKTMDYMKELYSNGWINKDFAVTAKTDQQQSFAQGKAGIYIGALFDAKNLQTMATGIQDNMELALVNDMVSESNPERAIWAANNGIGGLLAFPRSEVKDEAELKRILKFVNDLLDPEIYTLMTYGLEDVHYKLTDDDSYEIINQDLWTQEVQPFAASRPKESGYNLKDPNPIKALADEMIADNANYAVLNPAYSLESATNTSQGSELQKIITDATYQYILGEIELDGFKQAVKTWGDSGGNTIKEEYKAAYEQTK